MILRFVPRVRWPDLPVLEISGEFVFSAYDSAGFEAVRTYHTTLADALQQVVNSMRNYGGTYDVVAPTEQQKALNEAAAYLRRHVDRMRQQQRGDYSGERGRNIPMLLRLANGIKELGP